MFQPSLSIAERPASFEREAVASIPYDSVGPRRNALTEGLQRRWRRERRRRKVGRAFDMALEIARIVPANSRLLDVGCGNGFITHHLSAMLGTKAIGIDLAATTEAAIDYRQFDGTHFPIPDSTVDAVLLCYVLHHAQDPGKLMIESGRVLSEDGLAIVYEDIPAAWWDRFICWTHNITWRKRIGPCAFRRASGWRNFFNSVGFEVIKERRLARLRNLTHPVQRRLYLLRPKPNQRRFDIRQ